MRSNTMWMGTLLAVMLGSAGCGEECVDSFDCRDKGTASEGQAWACVEEKCTQVAINNNTGGDDAGTQTDAGTSTDAGTEADAGTETDAGTEPEPNPDPCESATYDPKLGTLQLQTGYVADESAAVSGLANSGHIVVTPGPTYSLYAVVGGSVQSSEAPVVYSLGTWPQVELGAAPLFDVLAPADRGTTPGWIASALVTDGQHLLTGYMRPSGGIAPAAGAVGVHDLTASDASTYLPAPNILYAGAAPGLFLTVSDGLGTVSEGRSVYALKTGAAPFTALKVGTFPENNNGGGAISVSSNGVAMLSYLASSDGRYHGHAVAPAVMDQALDTGTPFAVADAPEAFSFLGPVSAMGDGVAVLRGGDTPPDFAFTDVSRFPFTVTNAGASVTVGAPESVLVFPNQCTLVTTMVPMGSDLLVKVQDKNGARLVRIRDAR
ncbi:hypothetical protein ACQKGO_11630 [Corallococcus interemptor]|uniref:hypothetical protein n=1 Tax=Corallococcus interemptor TaxID=2316720 RepID=UPI003D05ADDD